MTDVELSDDERKPLVIARLRKLKGAEVHPEAVAGLVTFALGNLTAEEAVRRRG